MGFIFLIWLIAIIPLGLIVIAQNEDALAVCITIAFLAVLGTATYLVARLFVGPGTRAVDIAVLSAVGIYLGGAALLVAWADLSTKKPRRQRDARGRFVSGAKVGEAHDNAERGQRCGET